MPSNPFLGANIDGSYGAFATMYHYLISRGQAWFVDSVSGANTNAGTSPLVPFATLQKAFDMATTNNDDHVFIAPTHAENIGSAGAITLSKNGIRVMGLGQGNKRPTLTWSATAGTFVISGDGNQIDNIRCTCSVDEVVKLFSVTGAYNELSRVDYFETATFQAIQFLLTSAAADYISVHNCYHYQATAAASAQKWIELVGVDGAQILDNTFLLTLNNAAGSVTISGSTAVVNCQIQRNTIVQTGGTTQVSAILLVAASTGYVSDNRVAANVTTLAGTVALASAYGSNNYVSHTVNKSGILDPVADA